MGILIGYNTNGFACHALADAVAIIAEVGYRAVAVTLDHCALNPFAPDAAARAVAVEKQLSDLNLLPVVETGARFLLDPRVKHEPTLISADPPGRAKRLDFLKKAVDTAAAIGAPVVSIWSGVLRNGVRPEDARSYLADGCRALCEFAAEKGVRVAFEPEPGMFVETMAQYRQLKTEVDHPAFCLTLDLGHALITEPGGPADAIREFASDIANIHIEDMKKAAHDHLMFGQGEMDFAAIIQALRETGCSAPVCVELPRHSHNAVATARDAMRFLEGFM